MLYLERKIDKAFERWFGDPNRLPIVLKGARQTGKTEAVRHFASRRYESVVEINFVEEPKFKKILADGYGAQSIVAAISRIDSRKRFLDGRRTLIFFDEIQEFPDIATSLKFFAQDGRYDVICSGSLLGVHYKRISSVSVGYKTDYDLFGLDFEEFLAARGYGADLVEEIFASMRERKPLRESTLFAAKGLFLDYCTTGGMPCVVRDYIERKSFEGSLATQRRIVRDYRDDIRKYAEGLDQTRILNVFDHVPVQLAKDNRKFQISKVAHGARFRDYRGCVDWLVDAGVVNPCHCLGAPSLPLGGNYEADMFKLYMADTGLLISMLDEQAQADVRANRNLGIYKGAVYENIVAEALTKCGCRLYYWRRADSSLEEDFFVRDAESLVPLEVKGGNNRSKSLRELVDSPRYPDVKWGIKLADANIGFADNILTMPWFCAFLVPRMLGSQVEEAPRSWFEPEAQTKSGTKVEKTERGGN